MQLRGQVRLRQALQRPGVLHLRSHSQLIQRNSGGRAELHLEELQVPGVSGAKTEAH